MLVWILFGAFAIVLIAASIPFIIADFKKNKAEYLTREQLFEKEEERLNDEGDILEAHAEVVDMKCSVNMVGHKEPKTIKSFVVTFELDDGEIMSVSVPEVFYEGFDIGLKGTLTLVDGQLKSFEPDEEVL